MNRRKALAVAGAISATAMGAAVALGANFGLFGLAAANGDRAGQVRLVDPVTSGPPTTLAGSGVEVQTVYVDVPGSPGQPATQTPAAHAPAGQAPSSRVTDRGVVITVKSTNSGGTSSGGQSSGHGDGGHGSEDD